MTDALEVFFIRIVGEDVLYKYHRLDWPDKSVNPDSIVDQLWSRVSKQDPQDIHKHCIRHSSSWRWKDGIDTKTYFVYSEKFDFTRENAPWIALDDPRFMGEETGPPEATTHSLQDVLAHAVRHLAFLFQERDREGIYTRKLTPETMGKLLAMRPLPAGKLDTPLPP